MCNFVTKRQRGNRVKIPNSTRYCRCPFSECAIESHCQKETFDGKAHIRGKVRKPAWKEKT